MFAGTARKLRTSADRQGVGLQAAKGLTIRDACLFEAIRAGTAMLVSLRVLSWAAAEGVLLADPLGAVSP